MYVYCVMRQYASVNEYIMCNASVNVYMLYNASVNVYILCNTSVKLMGLGFDVCILCNTSVNINVYILCNASVNQPAARTKSSMCMYRTCIHQTHFYI